MGGQIAKGCQKGAKKGAWGRQKDARKKPGALQGRRGAPGGHHGEAGAAEESPLRHQERRGADKRGQWDPRGVEMGAKRTPINRRTEKRKQATPQHRILEMPNVVLVRILLKGITNKTPHETNEIYV